MHASRPLVAFALALATYGVGHDIFHHDDDHTVPRIVRGVTSDTSHTATTHLANAISGDEVRMVPCPLRASMEEDQTISASFFLSLALRRDA